MSPKSRKVTQKSIFEKSVVYLPNDILSAFLTVLSKANPFLKAWNEAPCSTLLRLRVINAK